MEKKKTNWLVCSLIGFVTGILNGLFGAGGGMIAVPALRKTGCEVQESHATSIALILPLSVISAGVYLHRGHVTIGDAWVYLPGGIAGAVVGAFLLKKVSPLWLHRIFGVLILFAAGRILLR